MLGFPIHVIFDNECHHVGERKKEVTRLRSPVTHSDFFGISESTEEMIFIIPKKKKSGLVDQRTYQTSSLHILSEQILPTSLRGMRNSSIQIGLLVPYILVILEIADLNPCCEAIFCVTFMPFSSRTDIFLVVRLACLSGKRVTCLEKE